ncbi:hypothetical protein ACVWXU_001779 [Streptomyces sp. TE33382]
MFGPAWQTVYRRFAQLSARRVWALLHRVVLDELGAQGTLDWSGCAIDSVSLWPGCKRGLLTGPNPTDPGKLGLKTTWSPTETGCRCLWESPAPTCTAARDLNPPSVEFRPLVFPPWTPPLAARKLHADKGYDYAHLRQ